MKKPKGKLTRLSMCCQVAEISYSLNPKTSPTALLPSTLLINSKLKPSTPLHPQLTSLPLSLYFLNPKPKPFQQQLIVMMMRFGG